jgi:chromosomal replication initiator protein
MEVLEIKEIWGKVKGELRETIPAHAYYSWVDALEAAGYDNNEFSLLTVHMMAPQIVRQSYFSQISDAFKKVTGKEISFTINYDADLAEKRNKQLKSEEVKKRKGETPAVPAIDNLAQMQSFSNLNLKYKFENFVVGENNRFAHAAAFAVSQNPAKKYNPLFIYGASGLGKTHLMQAIGHYVVFNKPKLKVKYIKTEEYVNELIKNLQHGGERNTRMEKFRQYANARNDKRQFLAAVGGGVVRKSVQEYALKQGIYVILQSGETVEIAALPKGFKAKVW